MWLDELFESARTPRKRIEDHGDLLRRNETCTRCALVHPVLKSLGRDIHDPDQVVSEYSVGTGRADHVLRDGADETPDVLIEAKKLGRALDDGVLFPGAGWRPPGGRSVSGIKTVQPREIADEGVSIWQP